MSARNEPVSPAMAQSRDPEKGGCPREEMAVVADATALAHEPESMVNLAFVKNNLYEKGPDSMVVHVYVKEICRDASRVLFREQDFTLIFQTRWVSRQEVGQPVCFRQDGASHAFPPGLPLLCFRDGNFLRFHLGCGPQTIFRWQVKLRWVVPNPPLSLSLPGLGLPGPSSPTPCTSPKSLTSVFPSGT